MSDLFFESRSARLETSDEIAAGLGFGADQAVITWLTFTIIVGARIALQRLGSVARDRKNLHLTVSRSGDGGPDLESLIDVPKLHCSAQAASRGLRALAEVLRVTLLDTRGIV